MATTTVTITGNVRDMIDGEFDARRTKVYLRHNTTYVVDPDGGHIRLGSATVTPETDGSFSLPDVIASVDTVENLQATVYVDYADPSTRKRTQQSFGPYDLSAETGTVDITELEEVQHLDPSFVSVTMAQMQALVDQQELIAGLPDEAAAQAYNIENDEGVQDALAGVVVDVGDVNYERLAAAAHRAAVNADHAAAFARIQRLFTAAPNGCYLARSGNDYTFLIGLGSGRYGAFLLPRTAQSLNGVTYTVNCLNGTEIQNAMLSQDDTLATFAGSGTWSTPQPQSGPDVGYLRKDWVVTNTTGSTVTITSGTMLSSDSGRRVVIAGAGAAGADLVTTATYIDATHFGVGTLPSTAGSGRAAILYPTYRYNATAGATATWVSPANSIALGVGTVLAQNGGLGKVTITGASVGAVTANLCPTAQSVVDSGRYPNTILTTNGGTLNPTDRVLDCYSGAALNYFDVRRSLAEGLTADTYTVVVTGTGYTPTGGTGSRIYFDRFSYGLASTTVETSGAQLFTGYDLAAGTPSAWEYAIECKPHSGSTWTFIGQTAHQLEDQQTFTIKLDDATATPADGTITSCRSAEITRTTKLYHPDSGAALASNPIATASIVYRLDRNGLTMTPTITWAIETDVRTAYAMMPMRSRLGTRGKIDRVALEAAPAVYSMSGTGTRLGMSRSAYAYGWDSTGKAAAGMYVPDHYGFTNGYASDVDGSQVEDRTGTDAMTKLYFPWVGVNHTRTYEVGDVVSYTVRYFVGYFTDANASLAAA